MPVLFIIAASMLSIAIISHIALWIYNSKKCYWIIGSKGTQLGILGAFNHKQYGIEVDKLRDSKMFDDYVVWYRTNKTRDQIRSELSTMYHQSRPFRRIIENLHNGN